MAYQLPIYTNNGNQINSTAVNTVMAYQLPLNSINGKLKQILDQSKLVAMPPCIRN